MPEQAQQLKAIALKVRAKFYVEPARESAAWARKHAPDLAAPLPGLPPQALPRTMPSLDFRLVWHTGAACPLEGEAVRTAGVLPLGPAAPCW